VYTFFWRTHKSFRIQSDSYLDFLNFLLQITCSKVIKHSSCIQSLIYKKSLKTNYTFITVRILDIKRTYSWISICNISREIWKAACCLATSQKSPSILDLTQTILTFHIMLLLFCALQCCKNTLHLDFLFNTVRNLYQCQMVQ